MERRQLEYLVAVSKEGSLGAAAEVLHVSQPALSQAIKQLENELGCELFHRLSRGMILTSAGEALLVQAKLILQGFSTARDVVNEVRGLQAGQLEIVSLPGIIIEPLAPWIREFRRLAPHVKISISQTEDPAEVAKKVRSGDAELGFTLDTTEHGPDLESTLIGEQEIVAVFPAESNVGAGPVSVREMLEIGMIAGGEGSVSRDLIRAESVRNGGLARALLEVDRRESALSLVLAGAGVGTLPHALGRIAAANGAIVRQLNPPLKREIFILQRTGPVSPSARLFGSLLPQTLMPGSN